MKYLRKLSIHFRYFYGPIDETPFTLAVVLPDKYGNHEFVAQHEIRHSRMNGMYLVREFY